MRGWKLEILKLDVVLMFLNNTQKPRFIVFLLLLPFFSIVLLRCVLHQLRGLSISEIARQSV